MGEGRGLSKVGRLELSGGPAPPTSPWVPPLFRPEEFLRVPEYRYTDQSLCILGCHVGAPPAEVPRERG